MSSPAPSLPTPPAGKTVVLAFLLGSNSNAASLVKSSAGSGPLLYIPITYTQVPFFIAVLRGDNMACSPSYLPGLHVAHAEWMHGRVLWYIASFCLLIIIHCVLPAKGLGGVLNMNTVLVHFDNWDGPSPNFPYDMLSVSSGYWEKW